MDSASHLDYLQARLQARHGERLSESGWRVLEAAPDMASYLQAARTTALRRLIRHLPGQTDPHAAERSLREDWQAHVAEIAGWSPPIWQPAILWWATLPYLAPMIHLHRGEEVVAWMRDDPALYPYTQADPAARRKALAGSRLAPVLDDAATGNAPLDAWQEHWLTLLPAGHPDSQRRLHTLGIAIAGGVRPAVASIADTRSSRSRRRTLKQRFVSSFRRYASTPVAAFAFLGLSLLEYDRLRSGLVVRAVFPDPTRRPQWA